MTLAEVISSFTPLTVSGKEWRGACPECGGELAVIADRWRCVCSGQDAGDDAAGFLMFAEGLTRPEAEAALTNGRTWTPALIVPPRQPPKWGLHRVVDDPRPVLILDSREAAKAADEKLTGYLVCLWPTPEGRWTMLEPLRGKNLLLWPTVDGLDAMERLEAVLVDPAGLACTGSFIVPSDLAPWDAETDEIIRWAKERKRPLNYPAVDAARLLDIVVAADVEEETTLFSGKNGGDVDHSTPPAQNQQQQVAAASPPSEGQAAQPEQAQASAGNVEVVADLPPATPAPADAGLDAPPPIDWAANTLETRPKRPKRRLQVVGGDAIDAMESIDPDAPPIPHELSESGIAAHFVMLHRDKFRTVHEWSGKQGACWMAWDGSRWRREPSRVSAMQHAQTLANGVKYWDAARAVSELSKVKWESKKFIGAFLDLASYSPEFVAAPTVFDADKMLLGTPGGTVDLATGKLIEPEREHYMTRQTAVTPAPGQHPLFDSVIARMCAGDESMRGYIWRSLGYSLTADQREEVFWFLHGKPQSGKSTLIKAIAEIMGDAQEGGYAATFDMELFTEQRHDRGTERLAHLHGARFAWASETEEGKHFKAALLKLATGGDKLEGRFLYQEKFSFEPTHHLWIFGNERIHLKSADAGLKRRLHMIEYPGVISEEERDNTLKARLVAEYPQILHSMIQGCLDWQMCAGLGKPEQISDAVDAYMDSEDELGAWLDECTERGTVRTPIGEAFRSFSAWADKNGAYTISAKRFSNELEKRGFERSRSGGVRYVIGLTLKLGANL